MAAPRKLGSPNMSSSYTQNLPVTVGVVVVEEVMEVVEAEVEVVEAEVEDVVEVVEAEVKEVVEEVVVEEVENLH